VQLSSCCCLLIANKEHPFINFSIENISTLIESPETEHRLLQIPSLVFKVHK
jgi:hypothetical protein